MPERNGDEIETGGTLSSESIGNIIGVSSLFVTIIIGFASFLKSQWALFWLFVPVIIFVFVLYIFLNKFYSRKIQIFSDYLRTRSNVFVSYLLIFLILCGVVLIGTWGIPQILFEIRSRQQDVLEKNVILDIADLKSPHYVDSIFSYDQSYLSVRYTLVDYDNTEFIAKHSYTGNEKWFVYGRMKETGVLSEKIATTKIMYPNQALRFPFVSGEMNWKSNAYLLLDYGFSIEKYSSSKSLPVAGDVLLWDTIIDDNGNTIRYGQLAFVEKVSGDNVYVSESRLVIQEKATDIPMLPEGLNYVLICEDVQSAIVNDQKIDIYGVKLYEKANKNSKVMAELEKFDYMKIIDSDGPKKERCWVRSRIRCDDSSENVENALVQERLERMWYKLQDPEDESIVGWALLEDRNQPDEEMEDVHSIEHNFTGIGIYGHEPFMYDINDAYIIRTPTPERDTDFKTN